MLAFAGTNANAKTAASHDHAANLREIVASIALHEHLRRQALPAGSNTYERQFAELFMRQATQEELTKRLTPALAKVINPRLAARLAQLVGAPAFRAREMRAATGAPGYPSNADAAELRRIDADPAIAEFHRIKPAVKAAVDSTIKSWSREFSDQLFDQAWGLLDKLDEDLRNPPSVYHNPEVGKVGFEPLDQVVRTIGKSLIRFNKAFKRQERELKGANYEDYFSAKYLTNTQHLVNAYEAIERAEWVLESTVMELNAAIKEREEGVAKSPLASRPDFRAKFDNSVAILYTFAGDYGEAVRRMTAQHRKLVAFMQSHLFNVTVQDGKMVFSDEEDLRQANEIVEQLRQAKAKVDEVLANQGAREAELRQKSQVAPAGQRG